MADDHLKNGKSPGGDFSDFAPDGDSDLGNLPPLSDFESSAGGDSTDPGLPQGGDSDFSSSGGISGLPPLGEITVETPVPTGGNVKAGYKTPAADNSFDTVRGSTGFADLDDSDFTSGGQEIETPMHGSAFGASTPPQTSAPTMAMETPIFGSPQAPGGSSPFGFDNDAFGSPAGGTPSPLFGDTETPSFQPSGGFTPPPVTPIPQPVVIRKGGGMTAVLCSIIFLLVGVLAGVMTGEKVTTAVPAVAGLGVSMGTMPVTAELDKTKTDLQSEKTKSSKKDGEIATLQKTLDELTASTDGSKISPEQVQQLIQQRDALNTEVTGLTAKLDAVKLDLEDKNQQYIAAEENLNQLQNDYSIVSARRDGLSSEVERLETLNGTMSEADTRRLETRNSLEAAVAELAIRVREGIPLTPTKYDRKDRIAAVDALKAQIAASTFVDGEIMGSYTRLYTKEMDIAGSREYFFAKIPVPQRFSPEKEMWAECLMNGNWSVYFRSIDGKFIGVYENVGTPGVPRYDFKGEMPEDVTKAIEASIITNRTADFQQDMELLVTKQSIGDDKTQGQKIYDSL